MKDNPPKLFHRFFRWYCHPKLLKYIEGDLLELYGERKAARGKHKADLRFILDVLLLFRPGIIRPTEGHENLNAYGMYKSYFKIGWRSLLSNKAIFVINVGGLAIGIATCLIMTLFVVDELSFDRYNEKADRIVRVILKGKVNGEIIKEAVTPAPVAATLKSEFPEVESATRLRSIGSPKITYQNITHRDSKVAFVDPNFFEIFTLPFIQGDPGTALKEPNTIVITREQSYNYFGNDDPINKVLEFKESGEQYRVTGVIDKVPANSHFHFDLFASMEGVKHSKEQNWMESNYFSYLLLSESDDAKKLESKLPDLITKYMGPQIGQIGMSYEKFKQNGNEIGLFIQPILDIHLYSDVASANELEPGGDVKSVYIFGAVAVFMLLIACVNFMNLSTAAATRRSKEVGVKKVLGSQRNQLVHQFLIESLLSTCMAMMVAILIVIATLPLFNQLSGKELEAGFLGKTNVVISIALLTLFISILAGSYPAFFLSSFKPITALKNRIVNGGYTKSIRSTLVIFQFIVSACLILAIIIVDQQMSYIQNKDMGYDRSRLLVLREVNLLGTRQDAFRDQLLSDSRIENVTMSSYVPAGPTDMNMTNIYPGQQHELIRRTLFYFIDSRYLATMGMQLVAGRNFNETGRADSVNVIVNETAVKIFNLGKDPIGKILTAKGQDNLRTSLTVIGVVKNFHFRSLHESIAPLVMINRPNGGLIVRAKTKEMAGLISSIDDRWRSFQMEEPFSYALLDDLYNNTYKVERKMGNILRIFSLLTIFIACIGLFGLITFTAEQRIKEIGIRKVLGANVGQIITLLSKDLVILIIIAFIIAFPLGFYLMDKWLEDFAYKIEIQWWAYAIAGLSTLSIALFTMSIRTIKSSRANPVDSLRSE